jgi:hypothetical protein
LTWENTRGYFILAKINFGYLKIEKEGWVVYSCIILSCAANVSLFFIE